MNGRSIPDDVVLEARNIVKTYGGTRALKGVNFEIRRGTVTTLFGENGAGKSTLMKILSGVEQPTSGEIVLDGESVVFASTNEARDRGISIIHQELSLAPNLSIRDKDKGLSAGEKRMLAKARQILTSELTFALNVNEEEAEKKLDEALA